MKTNLSLFSLLCIFNLVYQRIVRNIYDCSDYCDRHHFHLIMIDIFEMLMRINSFMKMHIYFFCIVFVLLGKPSILGLKLDSEIPIPWSDGSISCGVTDRHYSDDPLRTTICDPDETLLPLERMITSDLLHHCQEYSAEDTVFFLLLANEVIGGEGNASANIHRLMEKGCSAYLVTEETSAIFLTVTKQPFQLEVWLSESLASTFPLVDRQEAWRNVSQDNPGFFSSAVNKIVYFYCQRVRAPPYQHAQWDALTFFWMIIVILLIGAVTFTVIHLIMVRYKTFHKVAPANGEVEGVLRTNPGRPNLGPFSMEMDDYGSTPFQPSGNLLLSTLDVTAVAQQSQQSQQTSSTANLLES